MTDRQELSEHSDTPDEIRAMAVITEELAPFDAATRRRILEWVVAHEADLPWVNLPEIPERCRS